MTHYICTGDCEGVSDKPGVCQAADCIKHGESLMECHCEDGKHENLPDESSRPERTDE